MNENVGGNSPCPCGSGRKFKRCCMKKTTPSKQAGPGGGPQPDEAADGNPAAAADGSGTAPAEQAAKDKAQSLDEDRKKRLRMRQRDASRQKMHDPRILRRRGGR